MIEYFRRIHPTFFPVVEPAVVDGMQVVIIWVPGGQNRPYKALISLAHNEKQFAYYIRMGASTVRATGAIEQKLLQLAASVPFDDRMNHHADMRSTSPQRIERHLREVKSALADTASTMDIVELCRLMRIVDGPGENPRPRNVGLLFFAERPHEFVETAWIDVVAIPDGPSWFARASF